MFDVRETHTQDGHKNPLLPVMRVVEQTIDKQDHRRLTPQIEIDGWWTSLYFDEATIIARHAENRASEQYHNGIKSDLDMRVFLRASSPRNR